MERVPDALAPVVTVARVAYDRDVKYPAAAIAYYGFVSFVPVLLLAVALLGPQLAVRIQEAIPQFLTPAARDLVREAMTAAVGRTWSVALAVAVLAWSGANVAVGYLRVVERVERVGRVEGDADRPISTQLRDAGTVLASLLVAVAALLATSSLPILSSGRLVAVLSRLVVPVALTVTFLPLLYVPSRAVTSVSGALPGALVAAIGWTFLHAVVQFYAANAGRYAVYGVLSGVIIILTSLYLANVALMLGIVVNATTAGDRSGTRRPRR